MNIERSTLSGEIVETKQVEVGGIPIGIVIGHVATWKADNHSGIFGIPDRILRGAYTKSLQEHKARRNRPIRLKDQHWEIIGGFPIETAKEDNVGLFAEGHINLEKQRGIEAYSLARQGVLVDFSVGHIVKQDKIEDGERIIMEADIIEASIVDEPKNQRAQITEVKSTHFADLPVAANDTEWDSEAARARVMELKYCDGNGANAFVGGQLIADVIEGKLIVIPAGLRIAAEVIKDSEDKSAQIIMERYFSKMKQPSPFETKMFYGLDDVKDWSNAEYKSALTDTGIFSNGAIRALIARSKGQATVPDSDSGALGTLIEKIQATTNHINA